MHSYFVTQKGSKIAKTKLMQGGKVGFLATLEHVLHLETLGSTQKSKPAIFFYFISEKLIRPWNRSISVGHLNVITVIFLNWSS